MEPSNTAPESTLAEVERVAGDAISSGLADLATGGPVAAVAGSIVTAIRDIAAAHTGAIAEVALAAADTAAKAAATVETHTTTTAAVLDDIASKAAQAVATSSGAETLLDTAESHVAAYAATHPILSGIIGLLDKLFPHETAALKELFGALPVPPPPAPAA